MTNDSSLIPAERIEKTILFIRNQRVMLDADLAFLYGITTKRLNEQVKRNTDRFPDDFMLRLTEDEKREVVANCDHLRRLKFSRTLPFAFTEHGAVMLASVLSSPTAIQVSIQVVRTFNRLREYVINYRAIARKLGEVEKRYDMQFKAVFDAIRQLMTPPEKPRKKIGF